MKKFFLFVLIAILFAIPALAQTAMFRDVPPSHYAFDAINWVSDPENGAFMVGDAGNNFHPSRQLTKFEAVPIYAVAAGFSYIPDALPPEERDVFTRSLERWGSFLDEMAAQYSSWNRTVDREIAFLLYRGIITMQDVQSFVAREGNSETRPLLTREEAVVWMVRLVGEEANALAFTLPPQTPFNDDAQISAAYRRHIYHARDIGIIHGSDGNMSPRAHFTRGEMATVFYNALSTGEEQAVMNADGSPTTITGTISNVHMETHVSITTATGRYTFAIASNAVIMIDNVQRTAAFLRDGMTVTMLVNSDRQIISLMARSQAEAETAVAVRFSDEGTIYAVAATPSVTVSTRRLRANEQIIEEQRTFSYAPNAEITRGGTAVPISDIQIGDMASFEYIGNVIHKIELAPRERAIRGVLTEIIISDSEAPVLVIEERNGGILRLSALPDTEYSRNDSRGNIASDLRVGDSVTAEIELNNLLRIHAVGNSRTIEGRITGIRMTETITEVLITNEDETFLVFIRPGIFNAYNLRLGMEIRATLDSSDVLLLVILR
ncbi:MAG: S-layer homology domain-containing protein [Clostridiales bacterium]|jgi:hypothetical protein|nr:S-layer homology domain-containing protein [Clostridiales bacterium]